jgi:flagella basal body P-ring formation protein FlgA
MRWTVLLLNASVIYGVCLPVQSARITAGDVAATVPAFAQLPAELELSFAPNPGSTRIFPAAELNQRLARYGIQTRLTDPVCFEWPMRTLTAQDVRSAMLAALPPGSEVGLADSFTASVPPGPLVVPTGALRNGTWRGYVQYENTRRFPLSVVVTVSVPWTRVVATEPILAGERITSAKLQVTSGTGEPSRVEYIEDVKEAAGRIARRHIRPGTPVEKSAIGEARLVSRGDAIRVDVVSGGAMLRFDGVAEGSAAAGALVPIRNPGTGKILHARIIGEGHARVDLSGKEK